MSAFSKSLIIADQVLFDSISGKWTIVGISDGCVLKSFPCSSPKFSVFAQVSDVGGELVGTFQVLDPDLQLVGSIKTPVAFASRKDTQDFMAIFGGVNLPKPGAYTVQFLVNNEVVSTTKLQVDAIVENPLGS